MDFTVRKYRMLLEALSEAGYVFRTFESFMGLDPAEASGSRRENSPHSAPGKVAVLRHDVDLLPGNALRFAKLEAGMGIAATYYFRIVPQSFDREIIRTIHGLGHEIGYHYEDLSLVARTRMRTPDARRDPRSTREDLPDLAIDSFRRNLETLRELVPVRTACMHGSPLSRFDNRLIWERHDYRDFGIVAEPYFDVDYTKVWYITDTGRSWGRNDANVRDRVESGFDLRIRSTDHLVQLAQSGELPGRIFINTHPQRWNDPGYRWARELALQNVKNLLKSFLIRLRRPTWTGFLSPFT